MISNIRNVIYAFVLSTVLILIFNQQINDLIGLATDTELTILLKTSFILLILTIVIAWPISEGSTDYNREGE